MSIAPILVTGAGGFIGRHVARAFAAAGCDVVALFRRAPGQDLSTHARMRIVQADLGAASPLPEGPFRAVVHCAAAIPATTPDEDALMNVNVEGTRRLLDHVLRQGVQHVVYCSSMAVYGQIDADVVDVDTPIQSPGTYGRSKLAGEHMLADICRQNQSIAGVSIRLPGVVGVGSHDNFLSNALSRIVAGDDLMARNPDALFNNIVHVADLAEFVMHLVTTLPPGHRAITIGAGEPLRIREVISLLYEAAGRAERVRYGQGGHPFLIATESARRLGYRVPTVADSVSRFAEDCLKR